MGRSALFLLLASACGRISFEPVATTGSNGSPTDALGDGAPGMGDGPMGDAFNACSFAIAITSGVRSAQSTCQGRDLIDACGQPGVQEVLFSFVPPTTKSYNIAAYDPPGTSNVSNSTQRVTAGCTGVTGTCAAITGTTLTAATTYYFAVEASSGCANIEFLIQ